MANINKSNISIVIPAKNEALAIKSVVEHVFKVMPDAEVIVANDGSTDDTAKIAENAGAKVISHQYSMGNGAAIKTGARAATGEIIIFMDSDGQHSPEDIPLLLAEINKGYDLVVGSRSSSSQASFARLIANTFYNKFSSWMVGHKIDDLTSGFRAVVKSKFIRFLYLLPNGFSYPTTSTMAFFRAGYSVSYVPITVRKRIGKSHIKIWKDGIRFLLIIFKVGTLYSPLKLFTPIAVSFFSLGLGYYTYTYITTERFTNMSALFLISSLLFFVLGLISEQISMLQYMQHENDE